MGKTGKKVIDIVNERIMAQLAMSLMSGESAPWQKPWVTIPKQSVGGHKYTGINRLMVAWDDEDFYVPAGYLRKNGGTKKEGAEDRLIIFWNVMEKEVVNAKGEKEEQKIPFMKFYLVYRLKDVEGIKKPVVEGEKNNKPYDSVEDFIKSTGITINHGGSKSFYSFSKDEVTIPEISRFENSDRYYETLLHEIAHATAHEDRLKRKSDLSNPKDYAREELIAEIASSYLCHSFGIDVTKYSAQYIQHWMQKIEGDKDLLVYASKRAEKILEYFKFVEPKVYNQKKSKAS